MANRMDDTTSLSRIIIHGNEAFKSSELLDQIKLPQRETIHENLHFFPFSDLKPGKIFQSFEPNLHLKNQIEESEEGVEVSAILVLISQIEIFSEGMHSSIVNLPYSKLYGFSEKDEKKWWNRVIVVFSFGEEDITEDDQIDQIEKSIDGNKGIKEIFKKAGSRYISVSNRTSLEEFIRRLQAQPITEKLVLGGSHSIGFQEMYSSFLKATNDGKKKAMLQDVHQRFIIFGEKKSGKSALGNLLLGKLLFASDFQSNQYGKGKRSMIGHIDIEIANNNDQKLNIQIVDQPECLKAKQYGEFLASCISNVRTTFLIVINISSGPLSEEEFFRLKDFHQILKSSGSNFFPNAGIVFTHEDELEEEGSRVSLEEILKRRLEHEPSYSFTHKLISLVEYRYILSNALNMSNKNRNNILRKLFQFPYSNQCIKSNQLEKSLVNKNSHSDPVNNGDYGSGVINNTQGIHLAAGRETCTNINVARGEEGASTNRPKEYKDNREFQEMYSSCLKATKKTMLKYVDQRFIIFGEKKSGKSALGNLLLGKILFASDFQCDQSGKMFMIGHTDIEAKIANKNNKENLKLNIQIVDQPEGLKAKQYGEFLASCISNVRTTFLIVINLKSGPLSEEEFFRLKDFHQILSDSNFDFLPNAGIVFTHEDELEEERSRASPEEILKHRLGQMTSYSFTHKLISLVENRYIFSNALNMSNKNRNKILRKLFQFPYSNQCIKSNPPEKSFAKKNTHSDPVNNGNYGSGVINNTQGIHLIAGKETNTNINVARGEEGASTKPKEYKDCGRYQKIPVMINLMSFWKRSGSVVDPNQDDVSCKSDPNFEDMIDFLQEELIPDPSMTEKRKLNNHFTLNNFEVDMTNALRILTEFSGKQLVIVVIYLDRDFNQKVYKEIMELLKNFENSFQLFVFKVESDLAKNKVKNNPNLKKLVENCCIIVIEKRLKFLEPVIRQEREKYISCHGNTEMNIVKLKDIQDSQPIHNPTVVIQVPHYLVFGDPGPNSLLFSYFHLDKKTGDGGMDKGDRGPQTTV